MLTVNKVIAGGRGLSAVLLKRAAEIGLDWDTRQKSRFEAVDSLGRTLGVFVDRGTRLRGGDVLVAEDGSLVRVTATPQPVMVVRASACAGAGAGAGAGADAALSDAAGASSPFALLRAAYHLGNRHVALELRPDRLQLEPDPVLADLLHRMGLVVEDAVAPFEPEGGAYGTGGVSGHDHGHGARHDHAGHDHEHGHGHGHGHGNAHAGHGHGHSHGDDHAHAEAHADHGHAHRHEAPAAAQDRASPATPHVHGPGCGHAHAQTPVLDAMPVQLHRAGRGSGPAAVPASPVHIHRRDCDHDHDHGHAHDVGRPRPDAAALTDAGSPDVGAQNPDRA